MDLALVLQNLVSGVAMGLLYGLAGLGVVLIWNAAGLINFAQGGFAMLGAYIAYTLLASLHLPFFLALPITVGVMGLVGVGVELFICRPLRKRGAGIWEFVIATLVLGVFLLNFVSLVWGGVPMPFPRIFATTPINLVPGVRVLPHSLWVLLIAAVAVTALQLFFHRTRIGKAMRAAAQNRTAAALMGIRVPTMVAFTFAVATGLAGISGIMLAPIYFVSLDIAAGIGLKAFASAVIGGLGNPLGALLGGVLIGVAETMTVFYGTSTYRDSVTFFLIILFLLFIPNGLFNSKIVQKA